MTGPRDYRTIARLHSDFPSKFGVPRQSGLVPELLARVVFEPEFRSVDAVRGIEGFSHLWLIWEFSLSTRSGRSEGPSTQWTPTVRPPRLRGERMGVFATRSPFRPNPIGLSSVALDHVELDGPDAPVLFVRGADLVDGTPILDIKPYLHFDSHTEAVSGFVDDRPEPEVEVQCPDELLARLPVELRPALLGVLARDPRPSHLHDPDRIFGLPFAGFDVRFSFDGRTLVVHEIRPLRADAQAPWPGYRPVDGG